MSIEPPTMRISYRCACCITLEEDKEESKIEYISLGSILVRKDSVIPHCEEESLGNSNE